MGKNTFGNNSQGWLLKKPSNNLMMAWTYVPDEFDFHPFSLGQWEHIAICFDDNANVFRYFKNGNLVSTEFRDINVNVSPYDLVIGHELGTGNWFDGKLDNLRISNVSRYSGSFNPSQTFVNDASVIAMYDFNEGSGNVAQDLSGNGRVLDLFNTNFSSDVPGGSSINQSAILWSNGSQDQTIIVSPTETTTYSVTVTQGNQTCTSEVTITVNQPSDTTITATINQGEIYSFNGQDLTTAGMYTATLQNAAGCDSLVTLYLQVISNESAKHTCGADNVHNAELQYGSMIDQQGNTYKTIVIGAQEWMAENLKTSIYRNGDAIANVTDNNWSGLITGAWCYYNNDSQYDCPYGKLYNWYAVDDSRNLCPTGWHVPTDAEWTTLTDFLGGLGVAGGKLKSTGLQYWISPNQFVATNESGFSGLPGGYLDFSFNNNRVFAAVGRLGCWWSSTEKSTTGAWFLDLIYSSGGASRSYGPKRAGFSVRCLRDQPASGRLEESPSIQGINIYPNPTNNNINVVIQATSETQTNIRITDLLGRVVLEQTEALITGSNTITYNISDFAKGVYLIQVSNGNEQKVFKLVKE
jgi:uncharacterized protein (TIGR02145 family)